MNDKDLETILDFVMSHARKLIPFSDNLNSVYQKVDRGTRNRFIQLRAKRTWAKDPVEKAKIKEISFWNLDLNSDDIGERDANYLKTRDMLLAYPMRGKKTNHKNSDIYYFNEQMEDNISQAIYWEIGDCGEMADLGTFLLDEYPKDGDFGLPAIGKDIKVELIDIPGVHSFVLVNRPENTDIKRLADFLDAYIMDVHTKEKYKIKDGLLNLEKFQYAKEIFKNVHNWKVLTSTYIGDNVMHSPRWDARADNSEKDHKWWKRGEFLRMSEQGPRSKQKIVGYADLVKQLKNKLYISNNLKQNIALDGRDIELLVHAKSSEDNYVAEAAKIMLDDITSYLKNKADVAKVKINIGKMSDSDSSLSSDEYKHETEMANTVFCRV